MVWSSPWIGFGVGVLLLAVVGAAVLLLARVHRPFSGLLAVLRGALQLLALSFVLSGVITSAGWVATAVVVMFAVAATTAARRIGLGWRSVGSVALAMAVGVTTSLALVFVSGAVEFSPRYVLAMCGIIIGNSMTVAALAGGHLRTLTSDHWDEVEGWLALGATSRQALRSFARLAAGRSITPSIDQTKTTGLVALPGAFVGAIFGGLSPLDAGRFQIVVLAAIMVSASIVAVLTTSLTIERVIRSPSSAIR